MGALAQSLTRLHERVFGTIERALDGWFLGLLARFCFASVLYLYFLNSAKTKVGDGIGGFFSVTDGAYYQILPSVVEAHGGEVGAIGFFPWDLIVVMGTYAEFVLPVLLIIGLFSRIAAVGMMVFIAVKTFVDIVFHQIGAETTGSMFDRFPDAVIADQRLLWLFPLIYVAVKGPGLFALDTWILGACRNQSEDYPLAHGQHPA